MRIRRIISIFKKDDLIKEIEVGDFALEFLKARVPYHENDPLYYENYEMDISSYRFFSEKFPDLLLYKFDDYFFYISAFSY